MLRRRAGELLRLRDGLPRLGDRFLRRGEGLLRCLGDGRLRMSRPFSRPLSLSRSLLRGLGLRLRLLSGDLCLRGERFLGGDRCLERLRLRLRLRLLLRGDLQHKNVSIYRFTSYEIIGFFCHVKTFYTCSKSSDQLRNMLTVTVENNHA